MRNMSPRVLSCRGRDGELPRKEECRRGDRAACLRQVSPGQAAFEALSPRDLVSLMERMRVRAVAYTYNEPLVAFEYVLDCAKAVREAGGENVLVSAGYVNEGPLARLLPYLDAANIDLKTIAAQDAA